MASEYPFMFVPKKLFCMFMCIVQIVGFILLAIFSSSFTDKLIENNSDMTDNLDSERARITTALLIFTIAGAVVHLIASLGIYFEHLYITAGVTLLEVATVVGALLEAIMIHFIFWFSFGLSVLLLAALALHLFDLATIDNTPPNYSKTPRSPTANPEDSE